MASTSQMLGTGYGTGNGSLGTVNNLAQSMAQKGYQIGQPMTNLMTPSTQGTNPVPQPMLQLPFDSLPPAQTQYQQGNTQALQPPQPLPSDTVTQTGQGGGQSTIPGASTAASPTQAGGSGSTPVTPTPQTPSGAPWGVNPATWARNQATIAGIPANLQNANAEPWLDNQAANSSASMSAAPLTIQAHQAMMGLRAPPTPDSPLGRFMQQNGVQPAASMDPNAYTPQMYASWLNAGRPGTNAQGQQLDQRGQVMAPGAWDSTFSGIAAQGGNTYTSPSAPSSITPTVPTRAPVTPSSTITPRTSGPTTRIA